VIPGTLKQIDAGLGSVGGVNNDSEVFLFLGNRFYKKKCITKAHYALLAYFI